ncbi:MAG: DNA repair protein [Pseudolabrys sp.]|nr:DNA repair protein [Pseudolabrys sp.]
MLDALRQSLPHPSGLGGRHGVCPLRIPAIDTALGGGLLRGALHEVAAASEAHLTAASAFVLGLVPNARKTILWAIEDMARFESGSPFGSGLDEFGLHPERLLLVNVSSQRDLLWTLEEALHCSAVGAVIGELRHERIDAVALRRLSLAAFERGVRAFLLRSKPSEQPSTAATRWVVGAAPSRPLYGPGPPRIEAHLTRNRRGPLGSWLLQWKESDECFVLASAHPQPLASSPVHRPAGATGRSVA